MKPKISYHFAKLPLTKLHYAKCGNGEPLIIVPATISEIDNWKGLIEFFGQKYTVYFFELPGHGKSEKFSGRFKSELVTKTVSDLIDFLGYKKVNLMGFSFGGILTIKILNKLTSKIEKTILVSPCLTNKALTHKKWQLLSIRLLTKILRPKISQKIILKIMHGQRTSKIIMWILEKIGKVEHLNELRKKILIFPAEKLDVVIYQIDEILNTNFKYIKEQFENKLYFAMSTNDPLLNYQTTENEIKRLFKKTYIHKFDFPYHQPPKPFTCEGLNENYRDLLSEIVK